MEMIHIMTRHPETIHPDDTLAKAKQMMDVARFRRLPVVKDGELVGMLTERDLRAHFGYLESTKVNAAMSTPVISVGPNSTVQEPTRLMLRHKVGGLPVLDSGKFGEHRIPREPRPTVLPSVSARTDPRLKGN